ncbi:conserved Plasmodium protein, unknown function [Plasmodium chabaudi chabaudi]|uniref:Uncharacterized protein n=1 Tax=Plasmodium chabaudi chabaudi TaxID=31271 RepID=A0A4V0K361_PLACU|nr:conserved Plasmodium protein, unknown function [Plasmodium chabaudi chabaudi]VTZ66968.1 conserved Plasmodium protein, unknown function [Plasmodium chabaudi chabaudi]|eukprot:XP_016653163.1 conserved Plasmodium protein, unknown function [Plasmodium chabaudi chabaudi]
MNSFNYNYTKNVLELEEIDNQSDATNFFNSTSDEEPELKTYSSILIDGENTTWDFINPSTNKKLMNSTDINKNILDILKLVQELNKTNKINNFIRKMEYNEIKELIFINTKLLRHTTKQIYNILNDLVRNKTSHIYNSAEENSLYDSCIKNKAQTDYKKLYKKNKTLFKKYIILQKYYKKICKKYKEENDYLKKHFLEKKIGSKCSNGNALENEAKTNKSEDNNVVAGINHNIINETIKDTNLIDINYKKTNRRNFHLKKNKLINWKKLKACRENSETQDCIKKCETDICTDNYLTISKSENTKDYNAEDNLIPLSTSSLDGLEKKASTISEVGIDPSQKCAENKEQEEEEEEPEETNLTNSKSSDSYIKSEDVEKDTNENTEIIDATDLKVESDSADKRESVADDENEKQ